MSHVMCHISCVSRLLCKDPKTPTKISSAKNYKTFQNINCISVSQNAQYTLLIEVSNPLGIMGTKRRQHTHTDIATYRLNRPRGQFSENTLSDIEIPCS